MHWKMNGTMVFVFFSLFLRFSLSSKCSGLNMGKGIEGASSKDVIASGEVSEYFTFYSPSKIMAQSADSLDFFYFSNSYPLLVPIINFFIFDPNCFLRKYSQIQISVSDHFLKIGSQLRPEGNFQVLEVEYHCPEEGGSLIDINMTLIPKPGENDGCLPLSVFWRKLCGNPVSKHS